MRQKYTNVTSVLLAGAYGDALGKPFETYPGSTHEIPDLDVWGYNEYPMLDGGPLGVGDEGRPAGRWTDDTQMTLTVARVLAENPSLSIGEFRGKALEAYRQWYRGEGPYGAARGVGGTIRTALESVGPYRPDIPANRSIRVGSGALMRAAPFALRFPLEQAIDWALEDTSLTHPYVEAYAATCALVAYIASEGMLSITRNALRDRGFRYTRTDALFEFATSGLEMPTDPDGDVADLLVSALRNIRYHGGNIEAVRGAIMDRGDTDTRASITAQLYVARSGRLRVPEGQYEAIERREEIEELERTLRALRSSVP